MCSVGERAVSVLNPQAVWTPDSCFQRGNPEVSPVLTEPPFSTQEGGCQLHTREGFLTFGAVGSRTQCLMCNELPIILGIQADT